MSALAAASRVSLAATFSRSTGKPAADRDLDAARTVHHVREEASAQRIAIDRRRDVLAERAGQRQRRRAAGDAAGSTVSARIGTLSGCSDVEIRAGKIAAVTQEETTRTSLGSVMSGAPGKIVSKQAAASSGIAPSG